jgi:hypothetical protein
MRLINGVGTAMMISAILKTFGVVRKKEVAADEILA